VCEYVCATCTCNIRCACSVLQQASSLAPGTSLVPKMFTDPTPFDQKAQLVIGAGRPQHTMSPAKRTPCTLLSPVVLRMCRLLVLLHCPLRESTPP
jgi:hypothetical protein